MFCAICKGRMKPNSAGIPKQILIPACSPDCLCLYVKTYLKQTKKLIDAHQFKKNSVKFEIIKQSFNFKSRVEALVASALSRHGIVFHYESILFYDDKYKYVPDFYLPNFYCFIEVKAGHKIHLLKTKHFASLGLPIYVAWL